MSVYEFISPLGGGGAAQAVQKETHLYGSSRLGILNSLTLAPTTTLLTADFGNASFSTFTRGEKIFELSNHLGNVLVTISDKKIAIDSDGNGVVDYYNADVISAQDYYPFGSQMPGRKFSQANSSYRYGFNGQEKSNDVTEGNYTAEYWEYDSRIGRRWNVDPVPTVGLSDYSTFGNNPISNVDPNGAYFFGWFGSTSAQRTSAKAFAKETGGQVNNITRKSINVTYGFGTNMDNTGVGKTGFYEDGFAKVFGKEAHYDFVSQSFNAKYGGKYNEATGRYGAPGPISGRVEMVDDPITMLGPGLIRGLVGKLAITAVTAVTTVAAEETAAVTAVESVTAAATPITKNAIIDGLKISNHAWRKSGLGRGASEELISNVISGARNAGTVVTETGVGKFLGNVIKVYTHNGVKVAVDETRSIIMSIRPITGFKLP